MAEAKSDSSNGPSFIGGQHDGSLSSNNPFAKPKLGPSLLRPPQLKPVLGSSTMGTNSSTNSKDESKVEVEPPKFVPLGAPDPPTTAPVVPVAATTFVFGQNLSERVLATSSDQPSLFSSSTPSTSVDHASTNGNSDLLFSTAAHKSKDSSQSTDGLAAAAAEYEAKHARAPPLPTSASPPLTGEEGERNVLQLSCRLFAFETGMWRERGRGVLRLNDSATSAGGSRLVLRATGSLRILINTKVWPEMVVERAGAKSLRLTATDAQARVNVFLIMASSDDITHLHRSLSQRVALLQKATLSMKATPGAPMIMAARHRLPREEDSESDLDNKSDKQEDSPNLESGTPVAQQYDKEQSGTDNKDTSHAADSECGSPDGSRSLKRKDDSQAGPADSPKRLCTE